MSRSFARAAMLLGLALLAGPLGAQLVPLGPAVRVDKNPLGQCPDVAVAPDGSFLVAWPRFQRVVFGGVCEPGGALYGRLFDANGDPAGERFLMTEAPEDCLFGLELGPFVQGRATATVRRQHDWSPNFTWHLRALSVTTSGEVQLLQDKEFVEGNAFQLRSGGFVFLRSTARRPGLAGRGIVGERFDAQGVSSGTFWITRIPGYYRDLGVAETADGGLIVTWTQIRDPYSTFVLARRFSASGEPLVSEFVVSAPHGSRPVLAAAEDGRFVLVWSESTPDYEVLARIYGPGGQPLSPRLAVNLEPEGFQYPESVAIDSRGDFAALWTNFRRPEKGYEIVGRLFDASGERRGRAVPVASEAEQSQQCGRIRTNGHGLWVVVWRGEGPQGGGVYVRRLTSE